MVLFMKGGSKLGVGRRSADGEVEDVSTSACLRNYAFAPHSRVVSKVPKPRLKDCRPHPDVKVEGR